MGIYPPQKMRRKLGVKIRGETIFVKDIPQQTLGPAARAALETALRNKIETGDVITLGPVTRAALARRGVRLPPRFRLIRKNA